MNAPTSLRRRLAVAAAGAALLGGLVACGSSVEEGGTSAPSVAVTGTCGEVETRPVDVQALHIDGSRIDYPDAPPAFGSHRSRWVQFGRGFYSEDRPEVAELVHNLEHGYTIAWYDETAAADDAAMDRLREIASDYVDDYERFLAVPWRSSDGASFPGGAHVALTRWSSTATDPTNVKNQRGNWLYCGTVEEAEIKDFFDTWPNAESAEPGIAP